MLTLALKKTSIIVALTMLALAATVPSAPAQTPTLILTVLTDKYTYNIGEPVTIYGNLTQNGQPISGALIAIQVKTPNEILLIRTAQTVPKITGYCPIYIWTVTPCDQTGNPQSSFSRNSLAHFKIEITNFSPDELTPLVTVNPFDANNISIGYTFAIAPILGHSEAEMILQITIPEDATLGTAQVYACSFTDWPELNGTAYCPEKSATFQITSSSGGAGSSQSISAQKLDFTVQSTENGTYSLSFRLHPRGDIGTYTIFATSQYEGQTITTNTGFLAGVKGDINEDGAVDSTDLGLLGIAWGSLTGDSNYNPKADLNDDGSIDSTDLGIMGMYWGYISG